MKKEFTFGKETTKTNTTNIDAAIRLARANGFTVEMDNYEIVIYKPGANVGVVFNRNDQQELEAALKYLTK